jgi:hypothetical protein
MKRSFYRYVGVSGAPLSPLSLTYLDEGFLSVMKPTGTSRATGIFHSGDQDHISYGRTERTRAEAARECFRLYRENSQ